MEAYDALVARWPVPVHEVDVTTSFGRTHALLSGPPGAPPPVLIPGGGATAAVWFAVAGALAADRRVICVDTMGGTGRSVPGARAVRSAADLVAWLDETLDGLHVATADLAGHSYGGWITLRYALDRPHRVRRLALLDPTRCFTGMRASYLLHAVVPLLWPSPARWGAFLDWETGGRGLDPDWREVVVHQGRPAATVQPRRPSADELGALALPVLVLAAGARVVPDVRVRTLPGVSHHQVPTEHPDRIVAELQAFLC